MNAIMTSASAAGQLQRYDAIRRKNAEHAYSRQADYNGRNKKLLDELEALLTGKKGPNQNAGEGVRDVKKLDAALVKQIALPLGEKPEETIDTLRDVRTEAISVQEPTSAKAVKVATMERPSNVERETLARQKRYAKAISAYSFQVEAKRNGFNTDRPSYNKIA